MLGYDMPTQYVLGGALGGAVACYYGGTQVGLSSEMLMCAALGGVGAYGVKMLNDQLAIFPKLQTSGTQGPASTQQMLYRMAYGAVPGAVVVGLYSRFMR